MADDHNPGDLVMFDYGACAGGVAADRQIPCRGICIARYRLHGAPTSSVSLVMWFIWDGVYATSSQVLSSHSSYYITRAHDHRISG